MKMRTGTRNILWIIISAVFWILVWTLVAALVGNELLLPSPSNTISRLISLASTSEFWIISFLSLLRILLGTVTGIFAGVLLAVPAAFLPPVDRILTPFISVIRSTPVASFIILVMLWMKSLLPSFIAFLMVVPIVYSNTLTGLKSVDKSQILMARQFKLNAFTIVRRIYIPSLLPFFKPAVSNALGLSWKAGIAAEVLSFFPVSIGRQLSQAKNELETTDLFAWTLTVILMSIVLELVVRYILRETKTETHVKEVSNDNS